MKKLINDPENVVKEALEGMGAMYPALLRVDLEQQIIVRADAPRRGKVGLVSGGGSGHEPLHGGFMGRGMLDVACPGAVFTSPVPAQILAAMRAVDGGAGIFQIIKNYTGDVLNFEMAAELARAEGLTVEAVITNDDVAVQDSLYTAGRRGVGLTVLLEKIVEMLTKPILADLGLKAGERVLAFVNGMGGTPLIELGCARPDASAALGPLATEWKRHARARPWPKSAPERPAVQVSGLRRLRRASAMMI